MTKSKIYCVNVALSLSPCDVFAFFEAQSGAVFLDSASQNHVNSRFDIIAIDPTHTLSVNNNRTYFNGVLSEHDAFSLLKSQLATLDNSPTELELPFTGGWLGYFGYDLGRTLEHLPDLCRDDINLEQMKVGLYLDALIYDKKAQQWFYVAQPHVDASKGLNKYLSQLNTAPNSAPFKLTSSWQSNMSRDEYAQKFAKIQAYLRSGDCYQINLAQRFDAQFEGSQWQAYLKLREHNRAPFSAFIRLDDAAILSISPERFIQVHNNQVQTKPIKGTLPRGKTPEQDAQLAEQLANSSKDRAENVMIVDLLRNDLGKVAKPGSVVVPSLFAIESFPAVHHLVSTVQSTLAEGKCAIDQLKAAFPGGSITGAPKIRAMEIIEELEPHKRTVYCGSIGYISAHGDMDTSITIRTLVAKNNHLYCWAGGGIVADSQVDLEYQETYHKVNKILPVLS